MRLERVKRNLFCDHPYNVALRLLGYYLVRKINHQLIIGKIVETEAYADVQMRMMMPVMLHASEKQKGPILYLARWVFLTFILSI